MVASSAPPGRDTPGQVKQLATTRRLHGAGCTWACDLFSVGRRGHGCVCVCALRGALVGIQKRLQMRVNRLGKRGGRSRVVEPRWAGRSRAQYRSTAGSRWRAGKRRSCGRGCGARAVPRVTSLSSSRASVFATPTYGPRMKACTQASSGACVCATVHSATSKSQVNNKI